MPTPESGIAVLVLRCVLDETVTTVVVLDRVHGDRLEATPAERNDDGIAILQDSFVPTMLLHSNLKPSKLHDYSFIDL